jgi:hypothetical protein
MSSVRNDNSCAQTLVAVRSTRIPFQSETGCALSAMRAPTASRQMDALIGGRARAKRFSPARSRILSTASGAKSFFREERRTGSERYRMGVRVASAEPCSHWPE